MNANNAAPVRVVLPYHLRTLAGVEGEAALAVARPVTVRAVLDALETRYPMLRGTIRAYDTGQRRPFLRFFACEEDWSLEPLDAELPEAVAAGREPLLILGAIAGG
jgi:molybdopterin synthase sulfur carrier subunit